VTVLFGGASNAILLADTWEWDGAEWRFRDGSGPSGLFDNVMAYDPVRAVMVLRSFGFSPNVWEWDGSSWAERAVSGGAVPFAESEMFYDSANGSVVVFVGNGNGTPYGSTWELGAEGAPVIRRQPGDVYTSVGRTLQLEIIASPAESYQWRRDGVDLSDGVTPQGSVIGGAMSAVLTVVGLTVGDGGQYSCVVTSDCGQSTSDAALVTVDPTQCPGDFDGDSLVTTSDLGQLLAHFGTPSGATYEQGDMNHDGDVDLADLTAFLSQFGSVCP
jgi:hypothetical protein